MYIQLGNLELKAVANPLHLERIQGFLDQNGYKREVVCKNIENEEGNYHIFDIPKQMVICGEEKMRKFIRFLQEQNLVGVGFKERIGLTYVPKND